MMYSLDELIPQKGPMRLIDELVAYGKDFAQCRVCISSDNLFVRGDRVPSWVSVEYMAQAIAAYAGIEKKTGGMPPKIGLLIGVRNLKLHTDGFYVGETYEIYVREEYRDDQVGVYACTINNERGDLLASASLKGYMGGIS